MGLLQLSELEKFDAGKQFHHRLVTSVNNLTRKYHQDEIGVLFSGGLDSLAILLVLRELGIKPAILYTLHLDAYHSEDAKNAIQMAQVLGYNHRILTIRESYQGQLESYVRHFIGMYRCKRKAKIETIVPLWIMFDQIKKKQIYPHENQIKLLLTGFGADDLLGSGKQVAIRCRTDPNYFTPHRLKKIESFNQLDLPIINDIVRHYYNPECKVVGPYYSKSLVEYMLGYFDNWNQLHKPYEKWIIKYAFPQVFKRYPRWFRKKQNMQVESRIREYFQHTLKTDSVIKLYNRMYLEECGNLK